MSEHPGCALSACIFFTREDTTYWPRSKEYSCLRLSGAILGPAPVQFTGDAYGVWKPDGALFQSEDRKLKPGASVPLYKCPLDSSWPETIGCHAP